MDYCFVIFFLFFLFRVLTALPLAVALADTGSGSLTVTAVQNKMLLKKRTTIQTRILLAFAPMNSLLKKDERFIVIEEQHSSILTI